MNIVITCQYCGRTQPPDKGSATLPCPYCGKPARATNDDDTAEWERQDDTE